MSLHFRVHKRNFLQCSLLMLSLLFSASTSAADVQAFVGARIVPVSSEVIEEGILLVRDGKIEQVGPVKDVIIPDGAVRIDVTGKTIIPGLICTHSHIGWGGGGENLSPVSFPFPLCPSLSLLSRLPSSFAFPCSSRFVPLPFRRCPLPLPLSPFGVYTCNGSATPRLNTSIQQAL